MNVPVIDAAATGRNINSIRRSAGITVRQIQTKFGFATPQAIYKWFRGDSLPTIDNLVILANIFGVTMDDIVIVNTMPDASDTNRTLLTR